MRLRLLALLCMLALTGYGQVQISGKVKDVGGQGLPGVNVLVKGTSNGTATNVDGEFTLQGVDVGATLVFSFIGYGTQEVVTAGQNTIDVVLQVDTRVLEEVVVVGYGTSTVREVTGAISSIKESDISSRNPQRIEQAMQGQMAGVNITTASGSPGGALNIRIRGLTTNGDNNPLILVDGIPFDAAGLSSLNPSDVQSMDVLKDGAAAIYGVRGANGVIFITTKKGRRNSKPVFDANGYYGAQQTVNQLNLLNAQQFAVLKNEGFIAGGQAAPYNNTNLGTGTNWQKEIFQTAPIQNYNLGVSGGSDKTTYSLGGSYLDQQGIVGGTKSEYKRFNGRLNIVTELAPNVTLTSMALFTNEHRRTLPESGIASVLYNAINASPIDVPIVDGKYTYLTEFSDIINPLAQIANTYNMTVTNKIVGKEELVYKINPNFELTGRAGYNYAIVDQKNFNPLVFYGVGKAQNTASNEALDPPTTDLAPGFTVPVYNSVNQSRTSYLNYNLEAFLNYNKTIGTDHKIKALLGTSYLQYDNRNLSGTAYNIPYNSWQYADIQSADGANLLNNTSAYSQKWALLSFFGRGEYTFKDKYLASVVLRRDGSTNFGANHRFGYFPSVMLGWVISQESFFVPGVVNFLKLRGGIGTVGNDKIGYFQYRGLLNGEGVYPFNDQLVTGKAIGTIPNPDLKWETTHNFNIGVDANLFGDKVNFSADYYIKTTSDLLFQPDVSGVLGSYGAGGQPPTVNAGKVRNQGFDFILGYQENIGDFHFGANFNLTTINNKVLALASGVDFLPGAGFGVGGGTATRMQVGHPIGYFVGYKTDGIYQTPEDISNRGVTQADAQPGDFRYKDLNGDGVVNFGNDTDKTSLGSAFPKVTMGLSINASYKGFDLSALLYTSLGSKILRNYERQQPLANQLNYKLARWTGPGTSNSEPRVTTGTNRNNVLSDYYIEDGSYLRVKNIQVGFTIPSEIARKIGAKKLRFYVASTNPFTLTKYKGFDPDISNGQPLGGGIDSGFYPQAKMIMGGFNFNF